jgi:hypothetical protein
MAFDIVSLKEGEQGWTKICRCFEAKIYSDLQVSNVGTQQAVVTPLRSTSVGSLMIHDDFLLLSKNKCRQCFDADPGRGEPKLKCTVAQKFAQSFQSI